MSHIKWVTFWGIATWWRVFNSRFWLEQTSSENWTIAFTDSPRSGAGDSISSSNISKAIVATSSSPFARHWRETFKMLGINSLNLICERVDERKLVHNSHSTVRSVYFKKKFSGRERKHKASRQLDKKLHSRHAIMRNGNAVESITEKKSHTRQEKMDITNSQTYHISSIINKFKKRSNSPNRKEN